MSNDSETVVVKASTQFFQGQWDSILPTPQPTMGLANTADTTATDTTSAVTNETKPPAVHDGFLHRLKKAVDTEVVGGKTVKDSSTKDSTTKAAPSDDKSGDDKLDTWSTGGKHRATG